VALRAEGIVFGEVCDTILCNVGMFRDQIDNIKFRHYSQSCEVVAYDTLRFQQFRGKIL